MSKRVSKRVKQTKPVSQQMQEVLDILENYVDEKLKPIESSLGKSFDRHNETYSLVKDLESRVTKIERNTLAAARELVQK